MNKMTPKVADAMAASLPYLVYAIKRDGRIVYIGRGSSERACLSAREKGGVLEIIEAHASEAEMIRREKYWIECIKPELNKRPGEMRSADCPFQLPYQIRHGNVMFQLMVPIETAYSYHAIAEALRDHVGTDHVRARQLEDMISAWLAKLDDGVR